jgi:hypothetical protein
MNTSATAAATSCNLLIVVGQATGAHATWMANPPVEGGFAVHVSS